MNTQLEMVTET